MRNGHSSPAHSWSRQAFAWSVHFYTATGLVAAAGMAVLLSRPHLTSQDLRWTFVLMLVATLIDATDGSLARLVKVKEVLPGFDGRRLDDIVDFLTYTALPLFLIWRTHLLPPAWDPILLLPLLASAYGFSQVAAKTPEGYFLGFPSYWNLVAFYIYILPMPGALRISLLVTLAVLTFVPSLYLYPTQRGWLNQLTNVLGFGWALLLVSILWLWDQQPLVRDLALASLAFPCYYLIVSWLVTLRAWRRTVLRNRAGQLVDHPAPPPHLRPFRGFVRFQRFLLKRRR